MLSRKLSLFGKVAIIIFLISASGVFLVKQASVQNASAQTVTLPCTVTTTGNAWDGPISFGLASLTGANYLVIMDTNGTVIDLRSSTSGGYGVAKNIAPGTILFEGEPQVDGPSSAPVYATHIWNINTGSTQDFLNVTGEHDVDYDPANNTFLTLEPYVRTIGNNSCLFDEIVEYDASGNALWTWDTYNYIPLSEASPLNQTSTYNGQTVEDITHANTLLWDYNNGIIYLNLRNTNTFYKINQTTGNVIWACGEFGNFTMLGPNGTTVPGFWYGAHDLEQLAPDVFSIFNNDYGNVTNPNNAASQLVEFTLNENTMTASVTWSWTAPTQYYTQFLGANDLLPNGDWLGDFGSNTHRFPQNSPWNFNDTGADIIEVNPAGQIVRTISFPSGWLIYRTQLALNISTNTLVATPLPTVTPTVTPSPAPSELVSGTPNPSYSSGQTSPTPLTSSSPVQTSTATAPVSATPSPASNASLLTYVAIVIVVIVVIVLAVLVYLRFQRNKPKT